MKIFAQILRRKIIVQKIVRTVIKGLLIGIPTTSSGVHAVLLMTVMISGSIVMMQLVLPYLTRRWMKFCGDTSIEKAGLYFEGCERGSSDSIDGIVSSIPEIESLESWNLVDSLSELNVSEPGKRKQIGGLW